MATTMLGHMKASAGEPGRHLKNSIAYILNPEKTANGKYTGAGNCLLSTAYSTMIDTKKLFGKTNGRQGYHFVLSFAENDILDEKLCMQIVEEFADAYLGENYEYVYAVHNNTEHMHAHLVFNSLDRYSGKKYRYEKGDWAKTIQPITNRLCKKYGLSEIAFETKDGFYKTKRERILEQVEQIKFASSSFFDFIKNLEAAGYAVAKSKKYLSVQPDGKGAKYRVGLKDSFADYFLRKLPDPEEKADPAFLKMPDVSDIRYPEPEMYYSWQKQKKDKRTDADKSAWKYKKQLADLKKIQQQIDYLAGSGIKSMDDLLRREAALKLVNEGLLKERHKIYRERYPYKDMLAILEKMQSLEKFEAAYQNGLPYETEHRGWENCTELLKNLGYTYVEGIKIQTSFTSRLADIKEKRRMIGAEKKLLNQIRYQSMEREKQKETIEENQKNKGEKGGNQCSVNKIKSRKQD